MVITMGTCQDNDFNLEHLRAKVDQCDYQITELLDQRFKLVREIGRHKARHNLPVEDMAREKQVLSQVAQASVISRHSIENIFKLIINESLQIQKDMDRGADKLSWFDDKKIAVIGLGLIGTSICLALKKAEVNCEITGFDSNLAKTERVLARGAVDQTADNPADCVRQAELVVIAVPVRAIKQVLEQIAPHVKSGSVIIDVGGSKEQVCQWADSILPPHALFVGGHPLAGKTNASPESADENLFRQRLFVITPNRKTNTAAITAARQLINIIGAEEKVIPASEHDQHIAWVSHLPFLISACLVFTAAKHSLWPEAKKLAATGFRDMSRLASGNPEMYTDICITNRDNILKAMASLGATLTTVEELISQENADGLRSFFSTSKHERDEWQGDVWEKREFNKIH